MTQLSWYKAHERIFDSGLSRGVFYTENELGVPWNGLISVKELESGSKKTQRYIDGQKYGDPYSSGSFSATIDAYTYPEEFVEGSIFGLSYRTERGEHYQIHIVYNAMAEAFEKDYESVDDATEAMIFVWNVTTTPVKVPGGLAGAHIFIDSSVVYDWALKDLEDILYGTPDKEARLPSLEEVIQLVEDASIVKITDHGDGTWSAEGPDEYVYMTDATTFEIDYITAVYIDAESYTVHSL